MKDSKLKTKKLPEKWLAAVKYSILKTGVANDMVLTSTNPFLWKATGHIYIQHCPHQ